MSQSLVRILIHIIFSTKNREPLITPAVEPEFFAFVGGICRAHNSPLLAAGAAYDHTHLLVALGKQQEVSNLLMHIKKDSSSWIKSKGREFAPFKWQDGYAAFSIGQSQVETLTRYFANQKEHHRRTTFRDELLDFLSRYRVEYDEAHLWN